ncbi:MAG: hypothetical protein A2Y03_09580 [Omnitrophica WOR_2 bacterium GWF2_38_59]|nr:MAG: hypothetical protein A2Y03_09580 [Omnitrophica WOR_2 bacterium GWF2_38_59]OGX49609.1 MAG: hypothetical protein A2243_11785 [Omnitrophica WOR_2 bacterium RIFOXYA2_FULL_38_17]OGX58891.1 MAG: hypothetical protein A2306_10885 [Omnitrophica WOR_2 bacterium RIFOXYB2_FULL_38_16]OGX59463.1 MAG: hypothetical protein A2447_06245 [Omnitrophica WOR_2 bacterium RIFOXYC2_FULL_38_12]
MKYDFIDNFSQSRLLELCPKLPSTNVPICGNKALILDYGLYKYDLSEISQKMKSETVSDIVIRISLPKEAHSKEKMKEIFHSIYYHTFKLKKENTFLKLHIIEGKNFSWITNALPVNLVIEPTNACNLNCIGCREVYGTDKQGFMKFEDFKRVLLQFKDIDNLTLFCRGDPLLHPDINEFINFAKEAGCKTVNTSTNFNIENDSLIKKIAASKLDSLVVGLDGASSETYPSFRKGGNFKLVVSNIVKLKKLNPNCKLIIQFMPNKFNEHEIHKIKALSKKLGADFLRFRILNSFNNDFLPKNPLYRWEQLCKDPSEIDALISKKRKFVCTEALNSLHILWNGDIYPCCTLMGNYNPISSYNRDLFPKKFPYNIFTSSAEEIWMDEDYFNLRQSFLKDSPVKLCSLCNLESKRKPPGHTIRLN